MVLWDSSMRSARWKSVSRCIMGMVDTLDMCGKRGPMASFAVAEEDMRLLRRWRGLIWNMSARHFLEWLR